MAATIQFISPRQFQQAFIRQPVADGTDGDYFQVVRVEEVAAHLVTPTLLHRTTFNYFILLTKGEGQQVHNLDQLVVGPGTLMLVQVNTITALKQIDKNVAGFFVGFDQPVIEQLLTPAQIQQWHSLPACLNLIPGEQDWCLGVCELLINEQAVSPQKLTDAARHLLAAFITKLLSKAQDSLQQLNRHQLVTTRFKQLLSQYYHQQKGLSFYTDKLAISENYLFRSVKQVTGKSPKTLLLETMVLHAMVQLQNTTLDVSQIADGPGIDDLSYFVRLFKSYTRMTPTQYRQTVWQDLS